MGVTYTCKRCNRKVAFKYVHYNNNGKDLLCVDCYTTTVKKQLVSDKQTEVQKTISGKVAKEKYLCTKCRYHFMYKQSEAALQCPNCGHREVLKDNYNAEKLLQEAIEQD